MKRFSLALALLFHALHLNAQDLIDWTPQYKLAASDYKSGASNTSSNVISVNTVCRIDFLYQMSSYEFMFTKNFNSKVAATFMPFASYYLSPDKETVTALVNFGQLTFDLSELYARKLRQKIYEQKGTFSNANFFVPLYQEIQKEMTERHSSLAEKTDLGRNNELLQQEHALVLKEINELPDFCKSCKPIKKKKS